MARLLRRVAVPLLCLVLAACNTPRGAGFESEVLAAAEAQQDGLPPDFAVLPVTRATQAQFTAWPSIGAGALNWIRRQEQPASLIIAPGDVVSVTVWDAEENSLLNGTGQRVAQLQDARVSSGGSIFLPFVGNMRIAGMSPDSARDRIEESYVATIPSAQVQVSVEPGRANTANLVSGAASPGVYPLEDRDVTILDLISMAGGIRDGMVNPQVRLFRGGQSYGVALSRLYDEPGLDTTLVGSDRVIIQEEDRYFLSLGATGTESRHVFPSAEVSALDALSIIGGVNDERANPQGILILREYPTAMVRSDGSGPPQSRVVFTLDLTSADGLFSARNFSIMNGDLVYATESPVASARTILGLIGSTFGVASTVDRSL